MLSVSIDLSNVKRMIDKIGEAEPYFRNVIWDNFYQLATDIEKNVKEGMPVDTGRAKAGWGHYTPEHLSASRKKLSYKKNPKTRWRVTGMSGRSDISSESDAIWQENKENLEIIQGTNVPYTEYINAGSRGRAGTHHIDMAGLRADVRLTQWSANLAGYFAKYFKK